MTKFKVGDRVRPDWTDGATPKLTGTVDSVWPKLSRIPKGDGFDHYDWNTYTIRWDQDTDYAREHPLFAESNLQLIKDQPNMSFTTVKLKPIPKIEEAPVSTGGFSYAIVNGVGKVIALFTNKLDANEFVTDSLMDYTVREVEKDL